MPKTVCAIPHTTIASTDSEDFDRHFVSNVRSPSPASDLSGFESLHCDDENDLMCKSFDLFNLFINLYYKTRQDA